MARSFVAVTAGSGTKLGTNNYTDGADSKHDELMVLGEQFLPSYMVLGPSETAATANSHLLQIMAGASNKLRIRRIEVYQSVAATAAVLGQILVYRLTTAGTGGVAFSGSALDPADAAAGMAPMALPTVKGTEGAQLYAGVAYFMQTIAASNQLVQPIWVCDFDRLHSKPIIVAAGTTNGIAVKMATAVAGAFVIVNALVDESPY